MFSGQKKKQKLENFDGLYREKEEDARSEPDTRQCQQRSAAK